MDFMLNIYSKYEDEDSKDEISVPAFWYLLKLLNDYISACYSIISSTCNNSCNTEFKQHKRSLELC